MRLSHPLVPVVGLVVFVLLGLVFGVLSLLRWLRGARWEGEASRRRALATAVARVVSCDRVTERGDYRIVLELPGTQPMRGLVLLSPKAKERVDAEHTLPIRWDPTKPDELVIDLTSLGDEDLERAEYKQWGLRRWQPIGHAAASASSA